MRSGRWAAAGALGVAALAIVGFGWLCTFDDSIVFLASRGEAEWIVYPDIGQGGTRRPVEVRGVFRRSFDLDAPPSSAPLRVRSLRGHRVVLNGQRLTDSADEARSSWKSIVTVDAAGLLRAGGNTLVVEVVHDAGPPALWLELELPGDVLIATDGRWQASWPGAAWRPASPAREARGRVYDPDGRVERTGPALVAVLPGLSGLAALGAVLSLAGLRARLPAGLRRHGVLLTFLAVAVAWTALFGNNAWALRRVLGFDSGSHLEYVSFILERAALPMADDGWQMYQPPLYYLAVAAVMSLLGWTPAVFEAIVALRFLNLALALATLGFVLACLRRLFPDDPTEQRTGLLLAAFLPACLVLFQFPTNETMVIAMAAATVWALLRVIQAEAPTLLDFGLLGAAFGAALLSKVSALLLAPVVGAVLLLRLLDASAIERRRRLAGVLVALLMTLGVCGWYYARVWAHFGTPLMGNWNPESGFPWWQHPGYRTVHDYLRFGRSLVEPAFAGFDGAWDGFYSTLWGDGLYGGKNGVPYRPPWNYTWMTAGYLLALLPSALVLWGLIVAAGRAVRELRRDWAMLLGVGVLALSGMVYMTLKVPSYAQCKAFYGLIALVPLCAFAALGAASLWHRHIAVRVLLAAGLTAWAGAAYLSFWVDRDGAPARRGHAKQAWNDGDRRASVQGFVDLIREDPGDWESRLMLAWLLRREGKPTTEHLRGILEPGPPYPDLARFHAEIGWLRLREGRPAEALEAARRAVSLEPDSADVRLLAAQALWENDRYEASIAELREALRVDPGDQGIHASLANSLMLLGRLDEAERQCRTALRLHPGFPLAERVLERIRLARARRP